MLCSLLDASLLDLQTPSESHVTFSVVNLNYREELMVQPAEEDGASSLVELLSNTSLSSNELSSPATQAYLNHVTSLPLDTLLTEPSRLATESDILSGDLTQLCHSQHKTLLALRSASNALSNSMTSLTSSLEAMLDDCIPNLEDNARLFTDSTRQIQSSRAKASLVLEHHEKLLDVLELPHLLATCIKNGYYAEALDLSNHFETNLIATLPPSPLLESVHTSIVASLQTLLQQLLQQLRAPAKLPVLFKTVNLLRRMEVLSEEQLAVAFVLGRAAYLDEAFMNANASSERDKEEDPARWLRKWVEVFREGVYDVITQYSAIFLPSSTSPTSSGKSIDDDASTVPVLRSILSTLIQNYLTQLLDHLRTTLPTIPLTDMSSFSALLTQLSYCASSFARVGMDFRQALVPIVEDAIISIIGKGLSDAADTLEKLSSSSSARSVSEWLVDGDATALLPRRAGSTTTPIHIPPPHLAHFPPLASYVNDVLTAFNALRLVPAPSIFSRVSNLAHASLLRASGSIFGYCKYRQEQLHRMGEDDEAVQVEMRMLGAVASAMWHERDGVIPYLFIALAEGVFAGHFDASRPSKMEKERKKWVDWAEQASLDVEFSGKSDGPVSRKNSAAVSVGSNGRVSFDR